MDIKNDQVFDEFNTNEPTVYATNAEICEKAQMELPLPKEDFDKNGKLKKVRKRMLKKLVKTEIKHYKLGYVFFSVFVIVLGIFFAILLRNDLQEPEQEEYRINGLLILSGLMYAYAAGGFGIYAYVAPVHRYNKNFFKEEGYLTFSVPASMEEHVLAKRLTAMLGLLVSGVVITLSVMLTCLIADSANFLSEFFVELSWIFDNLFKNEPVHTVFFTIELTVMGIVGWFMMPCVFGAVSCALSKFTGKKKSGITILIVFLAVSALESLFITVMTTDILMFLNTPEGVHIGLWLVILIQIAITVGAFLFEIHYLKKKLNLR